MSGHSKWSKVKHQKEVTDSVKGKLFTKAASEIIIAIREGGGHTDPETNFKLRLAIEKAKSVNMPKENIQRAIERANKAENWGEISEVIYEAFGPKGVRMMIRTITDNRQRTVSEIKNILERFGGNLATSGAVAHFFTRVGLIEVAKSKSYDEMLETVISAGASDLKESKETFRIYTDTADLHKVREYLEKTGIEIKYTDLYFKPVSGIEVGDKEVTDKIDKLVNILEERDDVQKVYANLNV